MTRKKSNGLKDHLKPFKINQVTTSRIPRQPRLQATSFPIRISIITAYGMRYVCLYCLPRIDYRRLLMWEFSVESAVFRLRTKECYHLRGLL